MLIDIDNSNTTGIVNKTSKLQKSCNIEVCYFWLDKQKIFDFFLAKDIGKHHLTVDPTSVYMPTPFHFLEHAAKLSMQQGWVDKVFSTFSRHKLPKFFGILCITNCTHVTAACPRKYFVIP